MIAIIIFSEKSGDYCVIAENESENLSTRINNQLKKEGVAPLSDFDLLWISMCAGYKTLPDGKTKISIK